MHIDNLFRDTRILTLLRECYALEKVHGTSAHVSYSRQARDEGPAAAGGPGWTPEVEETISFFSGGEKHENFVKLFDQGELVARFGKLGHERVTVYGEAYGGRCQGMSKTYGPELKFVAFDVMVGRGEEKVWLDVPDAEDVCRKLGIDFVCWARGPATLEFLDSQRDADSCQANKNGMGSGHMREGVVIRPINEITDKTGGRLIAKHKRKEFSETKTEKRVDPARVAEVLSAKAVAEDWVTPTRLEHVLDKLRAAGADVGDPRTTPDVIRAMVEDVQRESAGVIVWSKDVGKAVGTMARELYIASIKKVKAE